MEKLGYPNTKIHALVYRRDTSIFPERSKQYGLGSTTAREMVRLLRNFQMGGKMPAHLDRTFVEDAALVLHRRRCAGDGQGDEEVGHTVFSKQ